MSIEQFTDRQLEFTIRYIGSVLDFLKSLQYKLMDEKSMTSVAKKIQEQLGVHNEKELKDFTLFVATGITSEECAAIFSKLDITNQCIIPTSNNSIIYAIKDSEYLEFSNYCEKIKKGEIDLEELVTEYRQKNAQNYIDDNSDLTHLFKEDSLDDILINLEEDKEFSSEEEIENENLEIDTEQELSDKTKDFVESNTDLTRELDKIEDFESNIESVTEQDKSNDTDSTVGIEDNTFSISDESNETLLHNSNELNENYSIDKNDNDFSHLDESKENVVSYDNDSIKIVNDNYISDSENNTPAIKERYDFTEKNPESYTDYNLFNEEKKTIDSSYNLKTIESVTNEIDEKLQETSDLPSNDGIDDFYKVNDQIIVEPEINTYTDNNSNLTKEFSTDNDSKSNVSFESESVYEASKEQVLLNNQKNISENYNLSHKNYNDDKDISANSFDNRYENNIGYSNIITKEEENQRNNHTGIYETNSQNAYNMHQNRYIPEEDKKEALFQNNYQNELKQQQDIRDRQVQQRQTHENATVNNIGKGYDIPVLAKYPDTPLKSPINKNESSNFSADNKSGVDILLNQITLRHGSNQAINQKVVNLTGGAVAAPVTLGIEDTKYAKGKKEFSNLSNVFAKSAVVKSQKNSMLLNMEKYQNKLETRQLKTLDSFLQNKGQKKLNFIDKNAYKESMDSIYASLEKCGLATSKRLDRNNISYDVSKFNMLYKEYKKGNKTDLIKALGFTATASEVDIRRVIEDLHSFTHSNRHNNFAVAKGIKITKGNYKKWGKKLVQKNATYEGYEDVSQTITTIRTSYTLFKTSLSTISSSYKKMYKRTGQWVGRRSKIVDRHVTKKIEKWDRKEKKKKDKKIQKVTRKRKKKIRQRERLRSIRNKAVQKIVGNNNYNRILSTNRAMKSAKRKVQKRISNTFIAKVKRKLFSIINPVMNAFNSLKLWLIKALGAAFLGYMLIAGGLMILGIFVTTVIDFFDNDDKFDVEDTFASDVGRIVLDLIDMEAKWADQLTDEEEFAKVDLDDILYTEDYLEIDDYAEIADLEYDETKKAIKGPSPFSTIEVKEINYKWIENIDGGIEISYKNASGGTDRTSNIKEIVSMASIYFENDTDFDSEEEREEESYKNIFASIFKKIAIIFKSKFESTELSNYCIDLFNVSHRETYELETIILPTKWSKEAAEQQTGTSIDGNEIKYCPSTKYDGYGCEKYDHFCYNSSGVICIRDKNNALKSVTTWVYPKEDDTCVCTSIEELETAYIAFPDCFTVTITENGTTESSSTLTTNASDLANAIKALNSDINEVGTFVKNSNISYSVTAYSGEKEVESAEESSEEDDDESETEESEEASTYKTVYNITITRQCSECHTGYYCGGHLKADVTGLIYGFLDEWADENATYQITGKVEEGTYVHQDVNNLKVDEEKLADLNDIFDCDNALIHPSEREDWDGWTADNMEQAIIKYQQDWEDIYGITINSALGGEAITNVEISTIMEEILKNYPNLSAERQAAIEKALTYVGNIGYSQKHHLCPLDGPCRLNSSSTCKLSDCSGFVSNIWYDRIGTIHSTYSFTSTYGNNMTGFSTETAIPGDILIHYGDANHALLYIGQFEYNGEINTWSIDCSTVKGVGNVFLRHRSYYGECKVINADVL